MSSDLGTNTARARKIRGTIGAHLVALVAIQLILVWGLIGFAAKQDFRKARADAEAHVKAVLPRAVDFVAQELDDSYAEIAEIPRLLDLVSLSTLCAELDGGEEEEAEELRWFHYDAHVFATDGGPGCEQDANQPNVSGASWFKAALASEEPVVEGPVVDPVTGKRAMMYAIALPDSNGVVTYALEFDSVGPVLDHQFGYGDAPATFLVTDDEQSQEVGSSGGKTGRKLAGTGFTGKIGATPKTFEDLEGTERIYAEGVVADIGWHVYAGVSLSDAFAPANRALRDRIVFALVILAVVVAAAFVLQRRFVRPIRSLARSTRKVSEGQLDANVSPSGPVELHELGESFNAMLGIRKEAEAALVKAFKSEQRAAGELRDVDKMRNAFLMAISHELRTPLTSVVGYSSFLKESIDDLSAEDVRISVNAIASQSKRLERLLLDLLDVERMSRGAVQPNLTHTEVRALVRNVLANMNLNGRATADVKGPARATVDAALVERILENLVSNAVKHTPADAHIWVRATRRDGELRLTVEDDGPGVPDDMKEKIFEPFKQGDVPDHAPGTGVGLTLVSQFAKLHGGRAWVEDRRGGGASFRVVLPANPD